MITEELAKNIVETQFESLSPEVIRLAKNRIIDLVGCIISGANAESMSVVRDLVKEWGGKEEATILVHGIKAPAHNVAMVNYIMGIAYDYGVILPYIDDKHVGAHVSEMTVPTAITVGDWRHASGKDMITALVVGDDLTARVHAAAILPPFGSGFTPVTSNYFGTTAITGKLLGLNTNQMMNALGIIFNQMVVGTALSLLEGVHHAMGLQAQVGILSAELASKGWTGIKDPLLCKGGYFDLYAKGCNTEVLTKNLGKEFYGDLAFKWYPCALGAHSSVECALNLVHEHDIKADDIEEVDLNVSSEGKVMALGRPFSIGDFTGGKGFSLRYDVANILVRKSIKLEHYTEEFVIDPMIGELTKKFNIVETLPPEKPWAADLRVKMKDGREFHTQLDEFKGHPIKSPLTLEEIKEKFRGNVAFSKTVAKENADKALEMLDNLEEIDNVAEVVRLLVI